MGIKSFWNGDGAAHRDSGRARRYRRLQTKGVERLGNGTVINVADVEGALAKQGVAIAAGSVVLLHTGWDGLWDKENAEFLSGEPSPGRADPVAERAPYCRPSAPTPGASGRSPARIRTAHSWYRRRCTSSSGCLDSRIWLPKNWREAAFTNSCSSIPTAELAALPARSLRPRPCIDKKMINEKRSRRNHHRVRT